MVAARGHGGARKGMQWHREHAGAAGRALVSAAALAILMWRVTPAAAESYFVSGISGGPDSLYGFSGVIWTPLNPLDDPGPIIRAWSKGAAFSYRTDLPANPNQRIDVSGVGLAGEAGWQWQIFGARLALMAGGVWSDHHLSPADPGSSLAGSQFGWSASFDADWPVARPFGVMANGNYIGLIDQYWVNARPYYQFDGGMRIGPDLAVAGGDNYLKGRAGLFMTGYEVDFPNDHRFFLGGEAGAEFGIDERSIAPYVGLNVGFFF